MTDIYKAPEANVLIEEDKRFRPHTFWSIFFWIHVVFIPLILLVIVMSDSIGFLDYVDLMTFPFILLALFGYVRSKKIGANYIWRLLCILYPIWFLFYEIIAPLVLQIPSYGEYVKVDIWLLLVPAFCLPTAIVLYLYAFKSDHVWKSKYEKKCNA